MHACNALTGKKGTRNFSGTWTTGSAQQLKRARPKSARNVVQAIQEGPSVKERLAPAARARQRERVMQQHEQQAQQAADITCKRALTQRGEQHAEQRGEDGGGHGAAVALVVPQKQDAATHHAKHVESAWEEERRGEGGRRRRSSAGPRRGSSSNQQQLARNEASTQRLAHTGSRANSPTLTSSARMPMSTTNANAAAMAPVRAVATMGVPVRREMAARPEGSRRSRPSTTSRRDWPSRPVIVDVTMPARGEGEEGHD